MPSERVTILSPGAPRVAGPRLARASPSPWWWASSSRALLGALRPLAHPPGHHLSPAHGITSAFAENSRWIRATSNTVRMVPPVHRAPRPWWASSTPGPRRPDFPGREFLRLVAILPLFSPPFTVGFSYLLMFGRFGVITHGLFGLEASILGWGSLWAVQTLSNFPYRRAGHRAGPVGNPAHAGGGRPRPGRGLAGGFPDHHAPPGPARRGRGRAPGGDLRPGAISPTR